jgi:hypothetical protein
MSKNGWQLQLEWEREDHAAQLEAIERTIEFRLEVNHFAFSFSSKLRGLRTPAV